ncbi:hypothetical protein V6N11_001351 [Hibiscus sabdariffa]|uniref:RNase H type-1 domain-containing protein n=1 Tax=Hibiscus sabdariffa TaxID=183260 RepID=A0ABR2RZF3_9ROSI
MATNALGSMISSIVCLILKTRIGFVAFPWHAQTYKIKLFGVSHLMKDCSFASELQYALDMPTSHNSVMNGWFEWLADFFCSLDESHKICLMECGSISNNEKANPILQSVSWQAPPEDIYKFNFDTSFNSPYRLATSGVIGRDRTREIMVSCVVPHSNVLDTLMAESLACLQPVCFAKELGIFEGDSLIVIKKINEGTHDGSTIAPVIHDIRIKARYFDVISFVFVKRDANNVAHVLTRDHRT